MVHTVIRLPFGTRPQENVLVRSCDGLVSLSSMVEHSRETWAKLRTCPRKGLGARNRLQNLARLGSFRHGSSDTSTENGRVEAAHVFLGRCTERLRKQRASFCIRLSKLHDNLPSSCSLSSKQSYRIRPEADADNHIGGCE